MNGKNFEAMEKEAKLHEDQAAVTRMVAKALDLAGFTFTEIKVFVGGFSDNKMVIELKSASLKEKQ